MFLLFAGSNYYSIGGWYDFQGEFSCYEDAINRLDYLLKVEGGDAWEWGHIIKHVEGVFKCVYQVGEPHGSHEKYLK